MSNTHNRMIVFASILGAILATGLLALNPSMVGAQQYGDQQQYGYNDNNNHQTKKSSVNIQKIKCVNSNINVNGIDITQIPQDDTATTAAAATNEGAADASNTQQNGNNGGLGDRLNVERNLVNVCANVNANEQIKLEPIPPEEPEPATLTVNKEIFGCLSGPTTMACPETSPDSSSWLPCIGSSISTNLFCQRLQINFFDIEVLDDQDTQIQEFEGSTAGTTIQNLPAGTYTVNEIEHTVAALDQLNTNSDVEQICINRGFDGGGTLLTSTFPRLSYSICFEYEDEQDNDCSTVTLAAGEDKTCTVKNYISFGSIQI